jgi:hypothetical protein
MGLIATGKHKETISALRHPVEIAVRTNSFEAISDTNRDEKRIDLASAGRGIRSLHKTA